MAYIMKVPIRDGIVFIIIKEILQTWGTIVQLLFIWPSLKLPVFNLGSRNGPRDRRWPGFLKLLVKHKNNFMFFT